MFRKVYDFLFKPRLLFLAPKEDKDIKISKTKITLKLIITIITTIWIGFLPIYLFVIYMLQNKFFSYDFFVEGFFGMTVFVVVTAIALILASLVLYGFLITAKLGLIDTKRKKTNCFHRMMTYFGILFSITMHFFIFWLSYSRGKLELFYALIIISLLICSLFLPLVGHGLKHNILQNWLPSFLFIFSTAFLPFAFQDQASAMVSLGLKSFNIGGGNDVTIKRLGEDTSINGKLLLLSPNNVYLKNGKSRLLIVPISEHTNIEIW